MNNHSQVVLLIHEGMQQTHHPKLVICTPGLLLRSAHERAAPVQAYTQAVYIRFRPERNSSQPQCETTTQNRTRPKQKHLHLVRLQL